MDQVLSVVRTMCWRVATPFAMKVLRLAEQQRWEELQKLRCSPSSYVDSENYWRDAMCLDLLRKCELPTNVDKEAVAQAQFWASETQCASTNSRMNRYIHNGPFDPQDVPVLDFISRWRKEVSRVMGKPPVQLTPRFSGGATYGDKSVLSTIPDKMSNAPQWYKGTISLSGEFYLTSWSRSMRANGRNIPSTVRGNLYFTVPKDGTKNRGCAKEASISVAYQLDHGRFLRTSVLPRLGIDLRVGQTVHQELAKYASLTGRSATLDMSNASDHWATNVIRLVCPPSWFDRLSSLRAPFTRIDGKWVRLEKFSSMGNGFTFELETVLFCTLARTVVEGEGGDPERVSCYGDDLIVPSEHARSVLAALRFFGHTPNEKKSFWEGPFRESCGGDYFSGRSVRTVKLEKVPDEPQQWIALANVLRACSDTDARWKLMLPVWRKVLTFIPEQIRKCRGPQRLGDLVIHDVEEEWWTRGAGFNTCVRVYRPIPEVLPWNHWKSETILACTTLCESSGVTPRGSLRGYKLAWSFVHGTDYLPDLSARPKAPPMRQLFLQLW